MEVTLPIGKVYILITKINILYIFFINIKYNSDLYIIYNF